MHVPYAVSMGSCMADKELWTVNWWVKIWLWLRMLQLVLVAADAHVAPCDLKSSLALRSCMMSLG
jgi:hypothetical protein